MTIKTKLFGSGIIMSALLCSVLALTIYFFNLLNGGFQEIVQKAGTGAKDSQSADAGITRIDKKPAASSKKAMRFYRQSAQLNKSIQQLDQVIRQNTGASEKMSSTAEEPASQAGQLQYIIAFFKIGGQAINRGLIYDNNC